MLEYFFRSADRRNTAYLEGFLHRRLEKGFCSFNFSFSPGFSGHGIKRSGPEPESPDPHKSRSDRFPPRRRPSGRRRIRRRQSTSTRSPGRRWTGGQRRRRVSRRPDPTDLLGRVLM